MYKYLLPLILASTTLASAPGAGFDCCKTKNPCCSESCCKAGDNCCKGKVHHPCAHNCPEDPAAKAK